MIVCHVMGCDARLGMALVQKLCCTFVVPYQDGDFQTAGMTPENHPDSYENAIFSMSVVTPRSILWERDDDTGALETY